MLVVVWEYEVQAGAEAAFEAMYGPGGAWVALFQEHRGYIETELLRGEQSRHYLTIDRWASATHYDAFRDAARERYAQVNAQGDTLTVAERCVGRYETPC